MQKYFKYVAIFRASYNLLLYQNKRKDESLLNFTHDSQTYIRRYFNRLLKQKL